MLKQLRDKKTAKKIWILLAILVLPAFVLWGTGSVARSRNETTYAGIIFGKKIPYTAYRDARQAIRNQMIIQFGDNSSEAESRLNIEAQAWNRLILLVEAKRRKIKVSDKEVVELLQSYPFFERKGRFDEQTYQQLLQYVFGVPARVFEEQTRENLVLSKLYKEIAENVKIDDAQVKEAYEKENLQISVYYIGSLIEDFKKDLSAKDDELKKYFAANSALFKQPLSFNLEYLQIDSGQVDAKLKIEKILARLNVKEGFKKIAKENGLQLKETGFFQEGQPIPVIGWSEELYNALLDSRKGELLPVVLLEKKYYIISVKEIKDPHIPDFAEIKDQVSDVYLQEKAKNTAKEKIESCRQELEATYKTSGKYPDLAKNAAKSGLKYGSTDPFKYASYIEGLGASDKFWLAANNLNQDRISQVFEVPQGFYFVRLKSKSAIDQKKFESEKEEFSNTLLLAKQQEYFLAFLEELKKKSQKF